MPQPCIGIVTTALALSCVVSVCRAEQIPLPMDDPAVQLLTGFDDDQPPLCFADQDEMPDSGTQVTGTLTEGHPGQAARIAFHVEDGGYGGFVIPLHGQNIYDFKELTFQARLIDGEVPNALLTLTAPNNDRRSLPLDKYMRHVGEEWAQVSIPIDHLRYAKPAVIQKQKNLAVILRIGAGVIDFDTFELNGIAEPADDVPQGDPLPEDHGHRGGRTLNWSGYDWIVKPPSEVPLPPGRNFWSDSKEVVNVDKQGRLHLAIRFYNGRWYCPQMNTVESLGYGTYTFRITGDVANQDRNIVLGLFTYLDDDHELDIEITSGGIGRDVVHAMYTVQPYGHGGNINHGSTPLENTSTHRFTWLPGRATFESYPGHADPPDSPHRTWHYQGPDVPKESVEKAFINYFLWGNDWPDTPGPHEVIIDRFEFTPADATE